MRTRRACMFSKSYFDCRDDFVVEAVKCKDTFSIGVSVFDIVGVLLRAHSSVSALRTKRTSS